MRDKKYINNSGTGRTREKVYAIEQLHTKDSKHPRYFRISNSSLRAFLHYFFLSPCLGPVRFQVHNFFSFLIVISSDDMDLLSSVFVRHFQVSIAFLEQVHFTLNITSKRQIRFSKHQLRCRISCDIKPRSIRNVKDVLEGPTASIFRIHKQVVKSKRRVIFLIEAFQSLIP